MILDSTADGNNAGFHRLVKLYDAPEFVKAAIAEDLRPTKVLHPSHYGDPRNLIYPLHTKEATWTNYAMFLDNCSKGAHHPADVGAIEERILHAGNVHGITTSLRQLKEAVANNRPKTIDELPDDYFAIVLKPSNAKFGSVVERHLPMRNPVEVVKAAEYIEQHRDQLPYAMRHDAAYRILARGQELGAAIPSELRQTIEKQAGFGVCTAQDVIALLETRVQVSRNGPGPLSPHQIELQKLAEVLKRSPAATRSSETRIKIAEAVDAFDRLNGLTRSVQEGSLSRVEDVLFGFTREKLASAAAEHTSTITGSIYRLDSIEQLKMASVRQALGDDIARSLSSDGFHLSGEKAAAVVPTLDRYSAGLFERLMESHGFAPVGKQASCDGFKISNEMLHAMANSQ